MTDVKNPDEEDDHSNRSSRSSSNASQTFSKDNAEVTLTFSPDSLYPENSPTRLLQKLQKSEKSRIIECSDDPKLKNIKKPEEEDKNKNVYVVSGEFLGAMIEVTGSTDYELVHSEIKEISDSSPAQRKKTLKKTLKEFENVTLNIAITGMAGAGKSSFINALRGLCNGDKGAAPTGVTETTMKPDMYQHPNMPNVKIWDLPGIGSPKFKVKKYLKDVKFHKYDFFLIVTSERFKENDIELARAIYRDKKLFYFIRTKIDNDVHAESHKRNFDERRLLDNIREDCKTNLIKVGIPRVFLISSFQLDKYDFQRLINTLEEELPQNKRFALIQSLPVYSLEALTTKITYFKKLIWLKAFVSGIGAALPIPGVSVDIDYGIVKNFFNQVFIGFGLSNQALEALSERVNKPVEQLKAARTSLFKDGVTKDVVIKMMSEPIMAVTKLLSTIMALLPGGALPAGGTSVATMHYLLNKGLNEMAEDTKQVLAVSQLA